MTATNVTKLSEFLKGMIANGLDEEAACEANELTDTELQEKAVEIYRNNQQVMRLVVKELMTQSSILYGNQGVIPAIRQPESRGVVNDSGSLILASGRTENKPPAAAPVPAPMPSASAIAKSGIETFLSSIKFRFFEHAWRNLGGVAFDAWDAVDEMWKQWSLKKKILIGAAMLFFLSGFGVFRVITTPLTWLYHRWHMPFTTSAEFARHTARRASAGSVELGTRNAPATGSSAGVRQALWRTEEGIIHQANLLLDSELRTPNSNGAEIGMRNSEGGKPSSALTAPRSALPSPSPVPEITHAGYAEGHRIRLEWKTLGPGYKYKALYAEDLSAPEYRLVSDAPVETSGALIDLARSEGQTEALVAVRGIAPDYSETALSAPVKVQLNESNRRFEALPLPVEPLSAAPPRKKAAAAINNKNALFSRSKSKISPVSSPRQFVSRSATHQAPDRSVSGPETSTPLDSPLASAGNDGKGKPSFISSFAKHLINNADGVVASAVPVAPVAEGMNAVKNAALQVSAEANPPNPPLQKGGEGGFHPVPVPQRLQWKKNSYENSILLTWKNMGPEYHYNLYASYANDHPAYDRDGSLFRDPAALWTPPAQGEQIFLMYVTAVNGAGEESEPSQRVLVDLR